MRKIIQWTLVPVAMAALACKSEPRTPTAMTDDLKRDIQLASATRDLTINPDEIAPKAQKELAPKPKKAALGPKIVRTEKPLVKASPTPVEVAEIPTDVPAIQVAASEPAPSETPSPEAPPLARPSPVPAATYPTAAPIPETSGSGGGILGGIFGAVIRGGVVGDDDHCDPRGAPARRPQGGRAIGGDIFVMPGTAGMGGMGGTRMPRGIVGRPRR